MSQFTAQLVPSGRRFAIRDNESVLDAALRAGVSIPYGCRNGACRSCEVRKIQGDIEYPQGIPEILNEEEIAQGWILLCQAQAQTNLKLQVEEIDAEKEIKVRTLPIRLKSKQDLAHDVKELCFDLPPGERLSFMAGQYVDIILRDGRRRAFSLANSPANNQQIVLHVRVVSDGAFSKFVGESLREKSILRMQGPLGNFYFRENLGSPVIFMAGGTGFSPVKSIIEEIIASGFDLAVHLYWGVRSRRDLYMHSLALKWAQQYDNFSYTPVLSEPLEQDNWDGCTGFVHDAVLKDYVDLSAHAIYMSGPPVMVNAGRESFYQHGAAIEHMFSDSFDYAFATGHNEELE